MSFASLCITQSVANMVLESEQRDQFDPFNFELSDSVDENKATTYIQILCDVFIVMQINK